MAVRDLIMIYHIPIPDNITRQKYDDHYHQTVDYLKDDRYFKQYFFPFRSDNAKFEVETININGVKKTLGSKELNLGVDDIRKIMHYIIKKNRINKIERINNILDE